MSFHDDCVFCQIARKHSRAYIVHETAHFICFFPIQPDSYGHVLIASRHHYDDIRTCPPEIGSDLLRTAQTLFERCRERLHATGFNLLNANGESAGQSVGHLHFHFFPRCDRDGLDMWPKLPPAEPNLDELFKLLSLSVSDM